MALQMVSFRLSKKNIKEINKEIKNSNFSSKSEFFRFLINDYLKKNNRHDKEESN